MTRLTWLRARDRLAPATWLLAASVLVWAALRYRSAYSHHFAVVHDPRFPQWWEWSDQGRYWRAAQAWASGSLDPARHWYFAGYPLLGALFFPFMPGHPFYWVDLAGLLLTGALLIRLAERLIDPAPLGRLAGTLAFALAVVLPPLQMKAFVEPWTTTPTAPLTLASLLASIAMWERPTVGHAALVGLLAGAVVLFRPADAVPLWLALAAGTAGALRQRRVLAAAAALAGATLPLALTAATYLAVFGWHRSVYLEQSAQTGFEWRLIPLRWVTLFVSAKPEYIDENSLAQTFFWVIPGVAGMLAALLAANGQMRWRHAMVTAGVTLHALLYMAYRDLHPQGLFRFGNYHYFKWVLPLLALYATILAIELCRRRIVAVAAGIAAAFVLFSWRLEWRDVPADWLAQAERRGPHTLVLPRGPASVEEALVIPAEGGFGPVYLVGADMLVGDRHYGPNADTKALPREGELIFTVLRPIPPGPTTITFNDQVTLTPGPIRLVRAHLFWRWPHMAEVAWSYGKRWLGDAG